VSEETMTDEEFEADYNLLCDVYDAAFDMCVFAVEKMNNNELGLACKDNKTAIEFLELMRNLLELLSEDDDDGTRIHFEYTSHEADNSASGSTKADLGETSGELRPSNRKLH